MRTHHYIWFIALAALLAAGALAWLRSEDAPPQSDIRPATDQLIEECLQALEADPQADDQSTQSKLRQCAVRIEEENTGTAQAAYLLGIQYTREHNLPVAETLFQKATELDPTWSRPWYELGTLLAKHSFGRTVDAEANLRRAIELDPEWARPHNGLAVLLRIKGNFPEAEKEAKLALELAPDDVASHNNYANLLISMGRYYEAEGYYKNALKLNPKRPKPHYNLACLYSLMNRTTLAMKSLEKAIEMAPILREEAWGDPDLENLHDNPKFQALIYGQDAP